MTSTIDSVQSPGNCQDCAQNSRPTVSPIQGPGAEAHNLALQTYLQALGQLNSRSMLPGRDELPLQPGNKAMHQAYHTGAPVLDSGTPLPLSYQATQPYQVHATAQPTIPQHSEIAARPHGYISGFHTMGQPLIQPENYATVGYRSDHQGLHGAQAQGLQPPWGLTRGPASPATHDYGLRSDQPLGLQSTAYQDPRPFSLPFPDVQVTSQPGINSGVQPQISEMGTDGRRSQVPADAPVEVESLPSWRDTVARELMQVRKDHEKLWAEHQKLKEEVGAFRQQARDGAPRDI